MSITINAEKKAAIDAKREKILEKNGAALDERQIASKKEEIAALVKKGKTDDAITQLMELL